MCEEIGKYDQVRSTWGNALGRATEKAMGALFLMRNSLRQCHSESQEECAWWGWEVPSEQL